MGLVGLYDNRLCFKVLCLNEGCFVRDSHFPTKIFFMTAFGHIFSYYDYFTCIINCRSRNYLR